MRPRAGFVLVAAIVAVVLIAALVTGAMFAANQETSATSAGILHQQASSYAERAAIATLAQWDCAACDSLAVGGVLVRGSASDPPLESTVYVTRLDSALFLVTAEGRVASEAGLRLSRRVSIVVKIARDTTGAFRASRVSEHAWAAVYDM